MYRFLERFGSFFLPTEMEERLEEHRSEIYLMDGSDTRW